MGDQHPVDRPQARRDLVDDRRVVQHEPEAHAGRPLRREPRDDGADGGESVVGSVHRELSRRVERVPRRLTLEHAPRGLERGRGVLGEPDGERCELVRVAAPGEDRVVEVGAQPRQRGAQRGLAQMQPLCRTSDAAIGQQGVQGDEQIQIESGEQRLIGHVGVFLRRSGCLVPVYPRDLWLRLALIVPDDEHSGRNGYAHILLLMYESHLKLLA